MLRALAAAILVLGLSGCQNMPPPYPPPSQFVPFETFRPYRISRIISVGEEGAAEHFVSGILPPVGGWSWTNQQLRVKVKTAGVENVRYVIDFSVADVTFKETGPVSVKFFVKDHELASERYTKPGQQHWEKIVPPEWLQPNTETEIGAEVDKVWTSPGDHAKLGLILTKIGLTESRPEQ
jgi:hypothetical protein